MSQDKACTVCKRVDRISEIKQKCIFHCEKSDWFSVVREKEIWDDTLVSLFWDELKAEQSKNNHGFYHSIIFPKFRNEEFSFLKEIQSDILFLDCIFLSDAKFGHYNSDETPFILFNKSVRFENVQFFGYADFFRIGFNGETEFNKVIFHKSVDFIQSQFAGVTNFNICTVHDSIGFHSAKFKKQTIFMVPTVSGEADFTAVEFDRTYFLDAKFEKEVKFLGTQFLDVCIFSNINFPKLTVFQKVGLQKVFFSSSGNLENVRFLECNFDKLKNRYIIFNEKLARNLKSYLHVQNVLFGIHSTNYEEVENVYRQFKNVFENNRNNRMAAHFYVGEYEMRRLRYIPRLLPIKGKSKLYCLTIFIKNYLTKHIAQRALLFFYRLLSGYGESLRRPTIAIFILITIYTGLYWYSFNFSNFSSAIEYSFVNFIPLILDSQSITNDFNTFQRWLYYSEKITSSVVWFALVLSIRRRFKR